MSAKILLVEDNEQIIMGNRRMLTRRGYEVLTASTLREAETLLGEARPDAIVLDILLPDGSGLDFMQALRQKSDLPILLLTGLTAPEDVVAGLSRGGDDYLTKPYDFEILLARIEALLRRAGQVPQLLQKGSLSMDVVAGRALLNGEDLRLTQKDFALLLLFTQNEERQMSGEYLYETVWRQPMSGDNQAIKSAVSRLRKKLTGSGYTISALRGKGYSFGRE